MRTTKKIYYQDPYLYNARGKVIEIHQGKAIELDRTIAYPEGGGQESDCGTLKHIASGKKFRFVHVKRVYGQSVKVAEGHWVDVEGIIRHEIHPDDNNFLVEIKTGDEIEVQIDRHRREQLSTSHSASHLLYMGIAKIRPELLNRIIGCHIREGQARFDFLSEEKVTTEHIADIESIANTIIDKNEEIYLESSDAHPDARYWRCDGYIIPCGGTHLPLTGTIGRMKIKRKNIGKGKVRLSCILKNSTINTEQYRREEG